MPLSSLPLSPPFLYSSIYIREREKKKRNKTRRLSTNKHLKAGFKKFKSKMRAKVRKAVRALKKIQR
jgi:hypothetical protein